MGLKVDNPTTYRFNEDVASYFDIEIGESIRDNDYELLKNEIYKLDIDSEEKANIINSINKLAITNSPKEKKELTKQIEDFKKLHNL
jgi:hypothetical protein